MQAEWCSSRILKDWEHLFDEGGLVGKAVPGELGGSRGQTGR